MKIHGTWRQINPKYDQSASTIKNRNIWKHTANLVSAKVYVFGGLFTDRHISLNSLCYLNLSDRTWYQIQATGEIPGVDSHTTCLVDDTLLVVGGFRNGQRGYFHNENAYIYDLVLKCWERIDSLGEKPIPCGGHVAEYCSQQRSLWVFGGNNKTLHPSKNGDLDQLFRLDLDSLRWSEVRAKGNPPSARRYHNSVIHALRMFIFGGVLEFERLNDLHILSTKALYWTKPKINGDVPRPVALATMVLLNKNLIVYGGHNFGEGGYVNYIYSFDPVSGTWSKVKCGSFINENGAHASVSSNDCMFSIGGCKTPFSKVFTLKI